MRPRTLDLVLTAAVFVTSVSESLISVGVSGPRWAAALLSGAMSLLLLGRRTHPVAMSVALLVLVLPTAAFVVNPSDLISTFFPLLILAYSGGAYASPRGGVFVLGLMIAGVVAVGLLSPDYMSADLYFPVIIVVLCWLGGRTVRIRARHAAELHETAALAAERREREAQEAVGEERRRIAREMHDVVAHSISVMVVQAGGARRILAGDPERAEEAARRIRAAGTDALAEMHILLGVLESAPDGAAPPTLDGLEQLVARTRAAGLPVSLEVTGERRSLSPGAELAVYRVVQEALTNAMKHAGSATTSVRFTWGEDALEITVADRGDGGPSPQLAGAGHGLMGMRERLRVYGGEVRTRAAAGGRLRGRRAAAARARDGGRGVSVRVLLVDDFQLVREGLRMALETVDGVEIVGEAGDGAQGVAEAERLRPDVVLMDVRMPELDGIEATRRIAALDGPPIRVLLLSTFDLEEYLYEGVRAGVGGITLKDTPPDELAAGIEALARGDALVDPETTVRLIASVTRSFPPVEPSDGLAALDAEERELLAAIARGGSDAEIGASADEVAALLAKLGVRERIRAVMLAHEARMTG